MSLRSVIHKSYDLFLFFFSYSGSVCKVRMPIKGGVGSFLTTKLAARSVRQRHSTGPQYYKRKFFTIQNKHHHQMHRRISGKKFADPSQQPEHTYFSHLGGDVARRPSKDYSFANRQDKVLYEWKKRGDFQVQQISGKAETFVCFRCGYPVRSNLQVIKNENWDWRMCYPCYQRVVQTGMERDT